MAATDRFMIAPLNSGLQTDVRPWLIPDDAFQELTNLYVYRGRVRKRFAAVNMNGLVSGIQQMLNTRLRVQIGTTSGGGGFTGSTPQNAVPAPIVTIAIGQMFSVGTVVFTVVTLGTSAGLLSSSSATGTINTTTGAVTLVGAPNATAVYYYPSNPVTGFANFNNNLIGNNPTFAFDPNFAYQFTGGAWSRLAAEATAGAATWIGNPNGSQLVWSYNWVSTLASQPNLYVTNYNYGADLTTTDLMRYWDGGQWKFFQPRYNSITSTSTVATARIIVPFKNRLVLLNVVENTGSGPGTNIVYPNRARWSWYGDPTATGAFYSDIAGAGAVLDAPTTEAIVTAQFLKDRLIVYFESSTWELVYTGNQILPFTWQQMNTELGAQSTFSEIPFDKVVLGIGNVGVHACNGSNVERIDDKIPEKVFDITPSNAGIFRVVGIRDYYTEQAYWTFPSQVNNQVFPNRILVYNYKTGSWAFFLDSFTAFGYYEQQQTVTWQDVQESWEERFESWNSGTDNPQFKQVVAGNQQGFTFLLKSEISVNEFSLYIANISNTYVGVEGGTLVTMTVINHNLVAVGGDEAPANPSGYPSGDYILIENVVGTGINVINDEIYPVNTVIDANTITIIVPNGIPVSGTYIGGGSISRISNINLVTKQYNFYVQEGRNASINKVDFLFDKTLFGQVTVDYSVSSSSDSILFSGALSGTLVNTGIVETSPYPSVPLEATQSRLWHPIYPFAQGECIQLSLYMSNDQMINPAASFAPFALHAMTFYATSTSSRLQ